VSLPQIITNMQKRIEFVRSLVPSFEYGEMASVTPPTVILDSDATNTPRPIADSLVANLTIGQRVEVRAIGSRRDIVATAGGIDLSGIEGDIAAIPLPNLIINGDFRINQRQYTSGPSLPHNAHFLDRWKNTSGLTTGYITWSGDDSGRVVTVGTAGTVRRISQVIEQGNIPAGTYTLSWGGATTGRVYNVGATAPALSVSPVTVTLDGTANVQVEFEGDGQTVSNVKLEVGSAATPFSATDWQTELTKCQRYYYRLQCSQVQNRIAASFQVSTTQSEVHIDLPVRLRAIPSISFGSLYVTDGVTANAPMSALSLYQGFSSLGNHIVLLATHGGFGAATRPGAVSGQNSNGYLHFESEL